MKEHRMGTGTRARAETRVVAEMGTGMRMEIEMERSTGSGRAEKRRRSAKRENPHKKCIHGQTLLFRTHHLGKQGVALESTRQLPLQGLAPIYAHRTEGGTGSEGRD